MAKTGIPLSERRKMVREFRDEMNWTLNDLAVLTDLSFAMIAKFENGTRNLSDGAWRRIHDLMKAYSKKRGLDSKAALELQLAQMEQSRNVYKRQCELWEKWADKNRLAAEVESLRNRVEQLEAFKANALSLGDEHLKRLASGGIEIVEETPAEQHSKKAKD
jgi:transcriptional regulator with XRE-family HTH domain